MIITVSNEVLWNRENIRKNPDYYSSTGKLFLNHTDEKIQKLGAKICYIPYIEYKDDIYKIGIINKNDLINDLDKWESFYLAGRFQKNIMLVKINDELLYYINKNRECAIILSLLLLNDNEKNLKSLYKKICSLSYIGDIRGKIAEDKNKIDNLIRDYDKFKSMYNFTKYYKVIDENDNIEINYHEILDNIKILPNNIKTKTDLDIYAYMDSLPKEELIILRNKIIQVFTDLTKKMSSTQTIKGLFTTGPTKSLKYVQAKLKKGILSKNK